jgi:DeoR family fructose operon transcriptional repressor
VFPEQRIQRIKALLLEKQQIGIQTMVQILSIPLSTIRRDLSRLEKESFLLKYHGFVMINPALIQDKDYDQTKLDPAIGPKKIIGTLAADMVTDNDVVFIGAGNSCFELAINLKTKKGLTVITNGFHVANELCRIQGLKVIFLGGDVLVENHKSFTTGSIASIVTEGLFIQKCFITVNGISLEHGYSINNHFLTQMYTNLLESSNKLIVLADGDKFDKRAFKKMCAFDRIKWLITDRRPAESYCEHSRKIGINIIYPGSH